MLQTLCSLRKVFIIHLILLSVTWGRLCTRLLYGLNDIWCFYCMNAHTSLWTRLTLQLKPLMCVVCDTVHFNYLFCSVLNSWHHPICENDFMCCVSVCVCMCVCFCVQPIRAEWPWCCLCWRWSGSWAPARTKTSPGTAQRAASSWERIAPPPGSQDYSIL